jgi:hypothetical protein
VNKQDYIAQVQVAVSQLHNCGATWREQTLQANRMTRSKEVVKPAEQPPK